MIHSKWLAVAGTVFVLAITLLASLIAFDSALGVPYYRFGANGTSSYGAFTAEDVLWTLVAALLLPTVGIALSTALTAQPHRKLVVYLGGGLLLPYLLFLFTLASSR